MLTNLKGMQHNHFAISYLYQRNYSWPQEFSLFPAPIYLKSFPVYIISHHTQLQKLEPTLFIAFTCPSHNSYSSFSNMQLLTLLHVANLFSQLSLIMPSADTSNYWFKHKG
jgi:hypothetical protein